MNPVHTSPLSFFNIYFIIIIHSTLHYAASWKVAGSSPD
jgi:hypothetical protein